LGGFITFSVKNAIRETPCLMDIQIMQSQDSSQHFLLELSKSNAQWLRQNRRAKTATPSNLYFHSTYMMKIIAY